MGQSPLFWICIALLIFLVGREIMCWYWRINEIIKNQNEQLDQMDFLIGEISVQNKLLHRIVKQIEQKEQSENETIENDESTP